jgi:DNA-binding transcriptional MerR regulator
MGSSESSATTRSLGQVVQATGLSSDLLRAWERRYAAIEPLRTPGGTRRYRDSDIARLRLLKSAVDAGYRIGEVADLSDRELIRRLAAERGEAKERLGPALAAVRAVDATALQSTVRQELERLGPPAFAREFALPLLQLVGDAWAAQELPVAGEHLASSMLRSVLGAALMESGGDETAPLVVFATPEGERHELGTLAAAVVGASYGLRATYLGADLPHGDLALAVKETRAAALALGIAHQRVDAARHYLAAIDRRLEPEVEIWIGGARCSELANGRVQAIPSFAALEERAHALRVARR